MNCLPCESEGERAGFLACADSSPRHFSAALKLFHLFPMRNIKLTIAYDGTDYAGWQVQPDRPTVQGAMEAAVEKVTGQRTRTIASGRTDAGVHALGQVVGFRTESRLTVDVLRRALDAELPDAISVLDAAEAPADFHPIRDAVRKRYRYVIHDGPVQDVFRRRYCWHYRHGRLDAEAMSRAAESLLGKHDFSSFETAGAPRETSVRTMLDIVVERTDRDSIENDGAGQGGRIVVEVAADGFLYNMVRAIVGTLVEVGRGARVEGWVADVIQAADRSAAGPTAPPQGLVLVNVDYD